MSTDIKTQDIDLRRVCELVNEAGHAAYVENTGGGCATIFASKHWAEYPATAMGKPITIREPERFGDPENYRHEVSAGPGWFEGDDGAKADTMDFTVGIDYGFDGPPDGAPGSSDCANLDEAGIAALIVEYLNGRTEPRVTDGLEALQDAEFANWSNGEARADREPAAQTEGVKRLGTEWPMGDQGDIAKWLDACLEAIGGGFHPDTEGPSYVSGDGRRTFTAEQAAQFERNREAAFALADHLELDLYQLAVDIDQARRFDLVSDEAIPVAVVAGLRLYHQARGGPEAGEALLDLLDGWLGKPTA